MEFFSNSNYCYVCNLGKLFRMKLNESVHKRFFQILVLSAYIENNQFIDLILFIQRQHSNLSPVDIRFYFYRHCLTFKNKQIIMKMVLFANSQRSTEVIATILCEVLQITLFWFVLNIFLTLTTTQQYKFSNRYFYLL